jgi:hypothetical protein
MIPVGLGRNRLAPEGRTADGKDCRSVATRAETGPGRGLARQPSMN